MSTKTEPTEDTNETALRKEFDAKLAEMQRKLDEVNAQLEKQGVMIQEKDTQIKTLKASKAGWLITAPNPLYDGITAGAQFVNGQAFIPDDRVMPAFVFKPMKEHELEKMPEAERIAVREREAIPSSRRAAEFMRDDFGYTIQHFDGEDESLQHLLEQRVKERADMQAILDAQNEGAVRAENLLQPNRFVGVSRG